MNRNSEIARHFVPLRPHPAEVRERAYRLYEQGKCNREIAEALGFPLNTVNRWSSKGKWKLRRRLGTSEGTDKTTLPPVNDNLEQAEIELLSFEEKQRRYADTMAASAVRFAYIVKNLPAQAVLLSADKIAKLDQSARKALKLENEKPRSIINIAMLAAGNIKRLVPVHHLPAKGDSSLPESSVPQSEEKALES